MPKRQAGALLIICGVVLALVTTAVAVIGGTAAIAVGGQGYLLLVACVSLLGVGVALLSVSGPIFGGTPARRALKTLAFGLIGDSVILGLLNLPGLQGSNMMVLFIPFFVFGWATVIGAVLTVLSLVTAGGRSRKVGAMFLAAPVALFGVNVLVTDLSGSEGGRLLAIAFGAVAGGALLLGFVGLAWLGWDRAASTAVFERAGEGEIG
jgi:hypothetical protein